jgi:hypothetical protein
MRKPGIYANIDIDEYHSEEGISSSGVSLILDCPKRYWYEYINKDEDKESTKSSKKDKFLLGSAFHTMVLEEEKFNDKYFWMKEPVNLTTKIGKELYAKAQEEANGREIIRYDDFVLLNNMAKSAKANSELKKLKNGLVEQSIYWDGVLNTRLRARPDIYNNRIIIDLKTTDSIPGFASSIYQYGYHRQAAMQIDGLEHFDGIKRHFAFFVIEKKPPYLTACFILDEESLAQGHREYKDAAIIYQTCILENDWPDYGQEFQSISLPRWAIKREEAA